jgi:YD repeat-containing protein
MEVHDTREFVDGDTFVRIREKYTTTIERPELTPYETLIERGIYDLRDSLLREEKWIVLDGGDTELVEWKKYTRDADGRVLKTESSSGKVSENEWSHRNLVRSVDESGEVHNYKYDAIDRMTHADAPVFDENMRYDLASQLTNLYGSAFGRRHDVRFLHDDAGTLRDVASDEGDVEKTVDDADGSTKTYVNGQLAMTLVRDSGGETTVYYGPKGRNSPRWRRTAYDHEHGTCICTYPCVGGEVVSVTNGSGGAGVALRERSRPLVRYAKRRGVWWKDTEMDGKTIRRRLHPSSDGFDETIYVDEKGFERRVSTKVDRAAAETVTIEKRPESELPSVSVCTNGELALHVSFSGVTNFYERGFQGRLVAHRDGRGGVERWTYDAHGREASHTDMNGRRREYEYDARGRVACVREDGRPPHRYIRDSFGRVVNETAGEKSATCLYDEYGDVTSVECRRGGDVYLKIGIFRDEATGLVTNRVVNGRGVVRTYDKSLKMISIGGFDIESRMVAFTNGLEIVRDAFGRPLSYAVCGRRMLEKSYDVRTGRVGAFSVPGIDGEAKLSYVDGADLVSSITYPNGVVAAFEYDAEGELVKVSYAGLSSGNREFRRDSGNEDGLSVESLGDDDDSILSMVGRAALSEDKFIYLDFTGGFERPVAEIGEDGRPRWCLVDADLKAKGVLP